ncbi:GNAT family N-acetyltransferase [Burkholderia glumae]|uniref:GNAT family N-acetyltransferase n=1 Tax=Burkholderia glumae TaxID=337 RepID=A0AAP9XWF1_BURGL|nr:GNAT family N-acetyltransferase [Burkholderia glumae]ACR31638.1 GCN5-like N-acetyltransferase [Burkholderia glumae BGR1]AJY62904.1 acetyltransferase domain protein [Burkholderia glumae LMG 2196 = ATCC 33617]KHJ62676.1 GCN5 family acetyltransferase [Burkholderia glumae]MCM2485197.1 GNAT family N-acetyltransferase [Burkholderia glumae]MCM2495544.1 GNAT family N-acetyltransferase [Burkholderia glumae]
MTFESVPVPQPPAAALRADAELTLRAATQADLSWLCEVFTSTRREEFMRTGWEPERVEAFLREQFQLQHQYYHDHYRQGCFDVVSFRGTAVGRLYHAWRPRQLGDEVRVIDIALLPAWRGRGIGTRLMHAVIAEAVQQGLPVSLNVEADNPVQRLYRRLGFVKVASGGVYDTMRREAVPFDLPATALSRLRQATTNPAMAV